MKIHILLCLLLISYASATEPDWVAGDDGTVGDGGYHSTQDRFRIVIDDVEKTTGTLGIFEGETLIHRQTDSNLVVIANLLKLVYQIDTTVDWNVYDTQFKTGGETDNPNGNKFTLKFWDGTNEITLEPEYEYDNDNTIDFITFTGTAPVGGCTDDTQNVYATVNGVKYYEDEGGDADGTVDEAACEAIATEMNLNFESSTYGIAASGCIRENAAKLIYNTQTTTQPCKDTYACFQTSCPTVNAHGTTPVVSCHVDPYVTVNGVDYYEDEAGDADGTVDEAACQAIATAKGLTYGGTDTYGIAASGCIRENAAGIKYNTQTTTVGCKTGGSYSCFQTSCPYRADACEMDTHGTALYYPCYCEADGVTYPDDNEFYDCIGAPPEEPCTDADEIVLVTVDDVDYYKDADGPADTTVDETACEAVSQALSFGEFVVEDNDNLPSGCVVSSNVAYYNTKLTDTYCSSQYPCIQRSCPTVNDAPVPLPPVDDCTDATETVLVEIGGVNYYADEADPIDGSVDKSECGAVAASFSKSLTELSANGPPPGCVITGSGSFFWNTNDNDNSCGTTYRCVQRSCPTINAVLPPEPEPEPVEACTDADETVYVIAMGVNYYIDAGGDPDGSVDKAACDDIAAAFTKTLTEVEANIPPRGCVISTSGSVWWNTHTGDQGCSSDYRCAQTSCPTTNEAEETTDGGDGGGGIGGGGDGGDGGDGGGIGGGPIEDCTDSSETVFVTVSGVDYYLDAGGDTEQGNPDNTVDKTVCNAIAQAKGKTLTELESNGPAPGCVAISDGGIWWNTDTGTQGCSSTYRCVQRSCPTINAVLPPEPEPEAIEDCTDSSETVFVTVSGVDYYLDAGGDTEQGNPDNTVDKTVCNAIAQAKGKTLTELESNGPAPGCVATNTGSIWWNTHAGDQGCSSDFRCIQQSCPTINDAGPEACHEGSKVFSNDCMCGTTLCVTGRGCDGGECYDTCAEGLTTDDCFCFDDSRRRRLRSGRRLQGLCEAGKWCTEEGDCRLSDPSLNDCDYDSPVSEDCVCWSDRGFGEGGTCRDGQTCDSSSGDCLDTIEDCTDSSETVFVTVSGVDYYLDAGGDTEQGNPGNTVDKTVCNAIAQAKGKTLTELESNGPAPGCVAISDGGIWWNTHTGDQGCSSDYRCIQQSCPTTNDAEDSGGGSGTCSDGEISEAQSCPDCSTFTDESSCPTLPPCCAWTNDGDSGGDSLDNCGYGSPVSAECLCWATRRRLDGRRLDGDTCAVGQTCDMDTGTCSDPEPTELSHTWSLKPGWNFVGLSVRPSDIDDIYSFITDSDTSGCIDADCTNGGDRIVLANGNDAMYYDIPDIYTGWNSLSGITSVPVGTAFYYKVKEERDLEITGTIESSVDYDLPTGYSQAATPSDQPIVYTGTNEIAMTDRFFLETPEANDRFILDSGQTMQYYDPQGWYSATPFELPPGQGFIIQKKTSAETFTITN